MYFGEANVHQISIGISNTSGKDKLLSSQAEYARLDNALQTSDLRKFDDCGHFLFLVDFSLSRS